MHKIIELDRIVQGYTPVEIPDKAGLIKASNVRMRMGGIAKRYGMEQFGDIPASSAPVLGLTTAVYPNGQDVLRFSASKVHLYNSTSKVWDEMVLPGTISTVGWTTLNVFNTLYCSPGYVFDIPGQVGILKQSALGGDLEVVPNSPGAKQLVSYAGRIFAIGTKEADGETYAYRVRFTAAGMPDTWDSAGDGSGYVDLIESHYPLRNAVVAGGRLFIFSGDPSGGAIHICTATQDPIYPLTFETVHGIGLLCRRAIVRASGGIHFFLGHDNFYALSGTTPEAIGDAISTRAIKTINMDREEEAFCFYGPGDNDITFVIPVGSTALEGYIFNMRTRTWAGPEEVDNLTCVASYKFTTSTKWSDLTGTTWGQLRGRSWASFTRISGPTLPLAGRNDGSVVMFNDALYGDVGVAFRCEIETGDYDFQESQFDLPDPRKRPAYGQAPDEKRVDGLFVRYRGEWTPTIYISPDGGQTWKLIWNSTLVGSMQDFYERLITFPAIVGRQFRVKIIHENLSENFIISKLALSVMWLRKPRRPRTEV